MPKSKIKNAALPSKSANQLRIIGGQWRGRKLNFPDAAGLRPTGDRIRETLFNWLAPDIQGAHCLDLFAGSGALGIEALSRGAAVSVLIERDNNAALQLRTNLALLNAANGYVIQSDALSYMETNNSQASYDVVFIDPPFELQLWQWAIDALEREGYLKSGAKIYIEARRDSLYTVPDSWRLHRDKTAGNISYRLFYRD